MKVLLISVLLFLPVLLKANTIKPLPILENQIVVECSTIKLPPLDLRKRVIVEGKSETQLTQLQKDRKNSPYIANSIYF